MTDINHVNMNIYYTFLLNWPWEMMINTKSFGQFHSGCVPFVYAYDGRMMGNDKIIHVR